MNKDALYNIEQKDNIIRIVGNVNFENVLAIKNDCINLINHLNDIKIDLSGVVMADSSIMLILLELLRYSNKNVKKIAFVNASLFIKDLSKLYELHAVLKLED